MNRNLSAVPLVYIVVLTHNKLDLTINCLDSLTKLRYPNFRVVVVDNASEDNTVEIINSGYPEFILFENNENIGFTGGVNVGIGYALNNNSDLILLLNNDTVVPPDLLEILIHSNNLFSNIGILSPKITYYNEPHETWFCGGFRSTITNDIIGINSIIKKTINDLTPFEVDYAYGTIMLVNREVFENIGLFDEFFFIYNEDLDFCIRCKNAGYKIVFVPEITIQHQIEASGEIESSFRNFQKARSKIIFYYKHTIGLQWILIFPMQVLVIFKKLFQLLLLRRIDFLRAYIGGLSSGFEWIRSKRRRST